MKLLRLVLAMVLFPLSLVWYRRDIQHYGIPPVLYWVVMTAWVVINVVVVVYALPRLLAMVTALSDGMAAGQ